MENIEEIKKLIEKEKDALEILEKNVGNEYLEALEILKNCNGKIIVIGIGKSAHIGKKISATFSSTGSPSLFLHGTEALHGDSGIISNKDVVMFISKSGNSKELLKLIPLLKNKSVPIISITGNPSSPLGLKSDISINIGNQIEIDEGNLAPTSSSTATLVAGDVLAVSLSKERGFDSSDFALFHPEGSLGKRLLLTVEDIMHPIGNIPLVNKKDSLEKLIRELTSKPLGIICVVNDKNILEGVVTDGDLRRALGEYKNEILGISVKKIMTINPLTISPKKLAIDALKMMEEKEKPLASLPVIDKENKLKGVIRIHDIIKEGI